MTSRRPIPAASRAGARGRGPASLSPAHLGEATAAATIAVIVGGIALAVTGIGVVVMSLALGARYGGDPPPDLGAQMAWQAAGGAVTLLLGAGLTAGGIAVLNDVRRSRLVTGLLAAAAAALAAISTIVAMTNPPATPVVAIALTVAAAVFGIAALLLLRPRR